MLRGVSRSLGLGYHTRESTGQSHEPADGNRAEVRIELMYSHVEKSCQL